MSAELLGPGDLLRPWQDQGEFFVDTATSWRVIAPTSLAFLDRDFQTLTQRWPSVYVELVARALERSRRGVLALGLAREPNLEQRLLVLLWHLAGLTGRQTTDGTLIPVRLTQETLGELLCASRTRTSAAYGRLAKRRVLSRRADHSVMLLGGCPFGDSTRN